MICALIACLHQFFLGCTAWLSLNGSIFTSVARSLRRWWYSEVSFDDACFINIFFCLFRLGFWRSSEETWLRVAVRQRDIKIAFRMGLTLAYSLVKHGISLNPSVSKTSKCNLGRFTLQLEQTQPVSCKLQLVLQLAFVYALSVRSGDLFDRQPNRNGLISVVMIAMSGNIDILSGGLH